MKKVIRDGKVAVLVSYGYGAGFSTWHYGTKEENETLMFSPEIVEMLESGKKNEIDENWIEYNLGIKDVYTGGVIGLDIAWLREGQPFYIYEYDGAESIVTKDFLTYVA